MEQYLDLNTLDDYTDSFGKLSPSPNINKQIFKMPTYSLGGGALLNILKPGRESELKMVPPIMPKSTKNYKEDDDDDLERMVEDIMKNNESTKKRTT